MPGFCSQSVFFDPSELQALKYFLQSRLTKCPMPLSLGRTKCMIMSDDFEVNLARK